MKWLDIHRIIVNNKYSVIVVMVHSFFQHVICDMTKCVKHEVPSSVTHWEF